MYRLLQNLITVIDEKITLGTDARLAIISYNSEANQVTSLVVEHNKQLLLHVIADIESNTNENSSTDGINPALDVTYIELQPNIVRRFNSGNTNRQVVFLLTLSDVTGTVLETARNQLYELMDFLVHVIVLGENCVCLSFMVVPALMHIIPMHFQVIRMHATR